MNWVLDYFRRSADHRLLFGGRVSYSGLDPLGTGARRARACCSVFPQLEDVRIESRLGRLGGHHAEPRAATSAGWRRMSGSCRASPATASR